MISLSCTVCSSWTLKKVDEQRLQSLQWHHMTDYNHCIHCFCIPRNVSANYSLATVRACSGGGSEVLGERRIDRKREQVRLCPIHTADADSTQLDSRVASASAVCIGHKVKTDRWRLGLSEHCVSTADCQTDEEQTTVEKWLRFTPSSLTISVIRLQVDDLFLRCYHNNVLLYYILIFIK